jgi:hypothetical protein
MAFKNVFHQPGPSVNERTQFKIGQKFLIILFLSGWYSLLFASYNPPIGIPVPEFGVEQTVNSIYGSNEYHTHFIDNTHPESTDSENPFGTTSKPRKSIPNNFILEAGSVVLIKGGPYEMGGETFWEGNGSVNQPVFIRGLNKNNKPKLINTHLDMDGQYFIVENIEFYDDTYVHTMGTSQKLAIRNCEIHNPVGKLAYYEGGIMPQGEDIVIYQNHIHHHVTDNPNQGGDIHGVRPGVAAKRIWILENDIHHNSGDAIQACHYCEPRPQYIYIGRNILHEDRENAVDLKYASDIIISQNKMYGYGDATTSDGSAVVLGSDGMPNRSWVIFNEIYDSKNGIRNEDTDTAWIIGNRIYNIRGFAIALEKKSDDLYIINNTIYNVDTAIEQLRADRDAFTLHVYNNIFARIGGKKRGYQLYVPSIKITGRSELKNNLFWQNGYAVKIIWGSEREFYSTEGFVTIPGFESNMLADPDFVDTFTHDFCLKPGSAAVNKGVLHQAFEQFDKMYQINIGLDCTGTLRPQGPGMDIGAMESKEKE